MGPAFILGLQRIAAIASCSWPSLAFLSIEACLPIRFGSSWPSSRLHRILF